MADRKPREVVETFLRVTARTDDDGVTVYLDPNGVEVALKLQRGGVVDLRTDPPFLSMFPCPYCGTSEVVVNKGVASDRGHSPLKHTNPYFGVKV